MLSGSVSDFAISPLITGSGFSASWHRPYNIPEATIYGVHNAVVLSPLITATGISYLNHPDYRWQDQYVALSLHFSGLSMGATQHLIFERIDEEGYYTWDNDLGLSWISGGYGTELLYRHLQSDDAELQVSALTDLGGGTAVCSGYVWRKNADDCYRVGTSTELLPGFLLQSSWQSEPARFGLGCKIMVERWQLMYSLRSHPELSLTHSLDLGIAW